jgi:hypothetical protein
VTVETVEARFYDRDQLTGEQRDEIRRQRESDQRPTIITRTMPLRQLFGLAPAQPEQVPAEVDLGELMGYGRRGERLPSAEEIFKAEADQ